MVSSVAGEAVLGGHDSYVKSQSYECPPPFVTLRRKLRISYEVTYEVGVSETGFRVCELRTNFRT